MPCGSKMTFEIDLEPEGVKVPIIGRTLYCMVKETSRNGLQRMIPPMSIRIGIC